MYSKQTENLSSYELFLIILPLPTYVCFQNEFVSSLFHFASSFNTMSLNDTEIGLFSAIVLLSADRPGVTDVKAIEHFQDRLVEALKVQVSEQLLK